jgi:hypothetical protein
LAVGIEYTVCGAIRDPLTGSETTPVCDDFYQLPRSATIMALTFEGADQPCVTSNTLSFPTATEDLFGGPSMLVTAKGLAAVNQFTSVLPLVADAAGRYTGTFKGSSPFYMTGNGVATGAMQPDGTISGLVDGMLDLTGYVVCSSRQFRWTLRRQ